MRYKMPPSGSKVSARGAEIQSLVDLTDGREIIWHGDATYWNGRSPILFPITGGLWNGTCRLDGRSYQIPKHGFVRRRDWQFVEQGEDFIRFAIENTDEELKQVSLALSARSDLHLARTHPPHRFARDQPLAPQLHVVPSRRSSRPQSPRLDARRAARGRIPALRRRTPRPPARRQPRVH